MSWEDILKMTRKEAISQLGEIIYRDLEWIDIPMEIRHKLHKILEVLEDY
jgi:hypothetical protein